MVESVNSALKQDRDLSIIDLLNATLGFRTLFRSLQF